MYRDQTQQRSNAASVSKNTQGGGGDARQNMHSLRNKAADIKKMLDKETMFYQEEREKILNRMEAQFQQKTQKLRYEYEDIMTQLKSIEKNAERTLKSKINDIYLDDRLTPAQQDEMIHKLTESFLQTFHPDDELERQKQKSMMNQFVQELFGGLLPTMRGGGGGLGNMGHRVMMIGGPSGMMHVPSSPSSNGHIGSNGNTCRVEEIE